MMNLLTYDDAIPTFSHETGLAKSSLFEKIHHLSNKRDRGRERLREQESQELGVTRTRDHGCKGLRERGARG